MSRETGPGDLDIPRVRVSMQIPLWGILGGILAVAGQATTLYFSQQAIAKEQTQQSNTLGEIRSDQRQSTSELARMNTKLIELTFQQSALELRMKQIEAKGDRR